MTHSYGEVFSTVLKYCRREGFRGYDPYDGCNTRHKFLLKHRSVRLGMTYFHKFSPVNLRPLFGVEKSENMYARALITSAILRRGASEADLEIVRDNVAEILRRSLIGHVGFHSWNGNGILIQGRNKLASPLNPGVVGTEAIVEALLAYHRACPDDATILPVVESARDFCLERLLLEAEGRSFFRYKPTSSPTGCTFNASMKGVVLVAEANRALGSTEGDDAVKRCVRFLLGFQKPDGAWNYSVDFRTGRQKRQIDYHQGFMLDGLRTYLDAYGTDADVLDAYRRGLAFYRAAQFTFEGQSFYRYPRKWPTNIINQAQGIVTFAGAAEDEPGYGEFAERIAAWTVRHMLDGGIFYYLKYRWFSNRIPYLRWSQAWMLYALSFLLSYPGSRNRRDSVSVGTSILESR